MNIPEIEHQPQIYFFANFDSFSFIYVEIVILKIFC